MPTLARAFSAGFLLGFYIFLNLTRFAHANACVGMAPHFPQREPFTAKKYTVFVWIR